MEATLKLAFSVYNNPGVYALLLGSGVSKSAGIPTGWDIKQDLNRQIKDAGGEEFSDGAGYDEMLKAIAKTGAERNAILRKYFEPTDEEREQGVKVPTAAHRAIARLVKDGFVKVVLTTNFDRLIVTALEEIGVIPDVIRSDDMLEGATPIRHSDITIVQLHGDYRDTRTLNTPEELEKYSDAKNKLLETIFDEYGLIICGWSATWDTALRKSLERVKQRRYSTVWIEPQDLSDAAQDLVRQRSAEVIAENADDFFSTLQGQVDALARLNREHPLSIAVAVERVKKLIPYTHTQIELEDILRSEAERAYETFTAIEAGNVELNQAADYIEFYKRHFAEAFAATETMLSMMTALCWYGDGVQVSLIAEILEKWAQPRDFREEAIKWRKMPALALMYVCGLSSARRDKWDYLQAVTTEPNIILPTSQRFFPLIYSVNKLEVFDYQHYRTSLAYEPVSIIIREQLRPLFKQYISQDEIYNRWFDLYEHILAVIMIKHLGFWLPHNAVLRDYAAYNKWNFIIEFYRNGGRQGENWEFITTFFDGDVNEFGETLNTYREHASSRSVWRTAISEFPDCFAAFTGEPQEQD